MKRNLTAALLAVGLCALVGALQPTAAYAGTILEMSLGAVSPDIQFDGTNLFTIDDGNNATTEDQDTGVLFLGALDPFFTDILTPPASFSLSGLQPTGPATLFVGSIILQNFTGGTFTLRDDANVILLQGNLGASALSGSYLNSTGGLFQTSLGSVTGGTLASYIDPNTVQLSMNFTAIRDTGTNTAGLRVAPLPPAGPPPFTFETVLSPFTADATVNIEATSVPEPAAMVLLLAGSALGLAARRRNVRR